MKIGKNIQIYTTINQEKYYFYYIDTLQCDNVQEHFVFGLATNNDLINIYKSDKYKQMLSKFKKNNIDYEIFHNFIINDELDNQYSLSMIIDNVKMPIRFHGDKTNEKLQYTKFFSINKNGKYIFKINDSYIGIRGKGKDDFGNNITTLDLYKNQDDPNIILFEIQETSKKWYDKIKKMDNKILLFIITSIIIILSLILFILFQ
jgi:hypothetical protein